MVGLPRARRIQYGLHHSFPPEGSKEARRYDLNQTRSPLLRLPYELRLQIYELVLADRQIHVRFVPWQQHKKRVKDDTSGREHTETIKGRFRHDVLPLRQDPWAVAAAAQNDPLHTAAADIITLLSGVCRQLHRETALLAHARNAWSFESTHVMDRYILRENRMPLFQRRAVRTLYCRERIPKALEKKFGGLNAIVWKDGKKLRIQDLSLFPDTAWKDRKELRERTFRW